jgi:tetratricopeptide (TPR) repeat protein
MLLPRFISFITTFICFWVNNAVPLQAASRLDSTLSSSHQQSYAQAATLCRAERWGEALRLYTAIMQAAPRFSPAHNDAGVCLARLGRLEESVAAHKNALALDKSNAAAWYNLGWSLNALGRNAEVVQAYHHALALNPHDTAALGNLGWTYLALSNATEAERAYRALMQLCPQNCYAHKGLGKALEQQSRTTEAIAAYERAVQLDPKQSEVHTRLAELFIQRNAPTKAYAHTAALLDVKGKEETKTGRKLLKTLFQMIAELPVVSSFAPIYERYVREFAPDESAFIAVQRLAEPALYKQDWSAAAKVFATHRARFPASDKRCDKLVTLLQNPDSTSFEVKLAERMDASVNTHALETAPSLALDEETLYFNREVQALTDRTRLGEASYALFAVQLDSTERALQRQVKLAESRLMPQAVTLANGIASNEAVCSQHSSANSSEQYSTVELLRMVRGSLEASQTLAWSGLEDVRDARITTDGNAILFVARKPLSVARSSRSDTPASHSDIYVSVWEGAYWGKPVSLGNVVNTGFNEYAPFLHPDGITLYFSSEGHYSLGRADVFVARRLDSSWTRWSQPVSLGKTINSPAKDVDFVVTTTGSNAYFSRTGDIFTAIVPSSLRPEPIALVHGRVELEYEQDKRPDRQRLAQPSAMNVPLSLRWVNTSTGATVARVKVSTEGRYAAVLPIGGSFVCYAEKVQKERGGLANTDTQAASKAILLGTVETACAAGTGHSLKLRRDFVLAADASMEAVAGYPARLRSVQK